MILLIIHNHHHKLNNNYSDETKKLKAFIDEYEDQTDDSKSFEKQGTPAITTATYPVWIGTNQFSLQYDPTKDTFYFDYLNMPYYTTGGKQAILQYNIYYFLLQQ